MQKQSNKTILLIIIILLLAVISLVILLNKNSKEETNTETKNVDSLPSDSKYSTVSEEVSYYENINGYLAKPSTEGTYPGVVMIHEWWGLNENIKRMADKLASQGYIVLAIDLYNGEVASESNRARELSSSVRENPQSAIDNMNSAVSYLKTQNADKIASLGWCFGGGQSLQLSLNNNVDATIIYYGTLVTEEEKLSSLESPVLGIFGEEDTSIPVETVIEFESQLDALEIENEIYIYPNVGHAFANPSGMNYAPQETEDAWAKTLSFLNRHLKEN